MTVAVATPLRGVKHWDACVAQNSSADAAKTDTARRALRTPMGTGGGGMRASQTQGVRWKGQCSGRGGVNGSTMAKVGQAQATATGGARMGSGHSSGHSKGSAPQAPHIPAPAHPPRVHSAPHGPIRFAHWRWPYLHPAIWTPRMFRTSHCPLPPPPPPLPQRQLCRRPRVCFGPTTYPPPPSRPDHSAPRRAHNWRRSARRTAPQ